jgi:hypothetical protein
MKMVSLSLMTAMILILALTKGKPCMPDDGGTEEPTDVEDMDRLVLTGLIMMMMGI